MINISPWAAGADLLFTAGDFFPLYKRSFDKYEFEVFSTHDAIWIRAQWPNGGVALFRAAYSPHGVLQLTKQQQKGNSLVLQLSTAVGLMEVAISFPAGTYTMLRYTATLTP